MRIRLTHRFTKAQRKAIARVMGTKKLATRTQCVQWVSGALTAAIQDDLRMETDALADRNQLRFEFCNQAMGT